jgi:3-oxoadipate enol-lactonase
VSPAIEVHHVADGPPGAPVLTLSNSLGATTKMWERQVPALAQRFRVVRYDLRGHGASPVPDGPYALEDLGADALALLDRLGVERAHVVGISLGGMIAMWLAIHAPDRVDRLVACCTSARLGPPEGWAERAALVRRRGSPAVAPSVVERWLTPAYREAHPEEVAELRGMVAGTPAEGYASCCTAIEHMDLRPDLPRIRAATLVISGADDPATPPEHGELIASLIRGARTAVLAPAAHLANLEQPAAFDALLLEFLAAA